MHPMSPVALSTLSGAEEALGKSLPLCSCHLLSGLPMATISNSSAHLYPLPKSVKDATLPGNYQG